MSLNIPIDQIRSFIAVVRSGSIQSAAETSFLTQPAVSSRIKQLESQLGQVLFDREPSGMRLTKKGHSLWLYACELETLLKDIERDIVDTDRLEGTLRIGVSETIAQSWLADWLELIYRRAPRLTVSLSVDVSIKLRDDLLNRRIDLAILLGPISNYEITNLPLKPFDMAWYRPRLLTVDSVLEALTALPIATFTRNTHPFAVIDKTIKSATRAKVNYLNSNSIGTCFSLVEKGLAIGALPKSLAKPYLERGTIEEFRTGLQLDPLHFTASFVAKGTSHVPQFAANLAIEAQN